MVTICFENKNETAEGKTAADAAKALLDAGADIVGMNCLRPPAAHAGADGRNAQSRFGLSRMPARRVPHAQRQARFHQPSRISLRTRPAAALSPRDGQYSPKTRKKWASTTSVLAADPSPTTFARWRKLSASSRPKPDLEKGRPQSHVRLRVLRPRRNRGPQVIFMSGRNVLKRPGVRRRVC